MPLTSHILLAQVDVPRHQGGGNAQEGYQLSQYAAYLLSINGDHAKPQPRNLFRPSSSTTTPPTPSTLYSTTPHHSQPLHAPHSPQRTHFPRSQSHHPTHTAGATQQARSGGSSSTPSLSSVPALDLSQKPVQHPHQHAPHHQPDHHRDRQSDRCTHSPHLSSGIHIPWPFHGSIRPAIRQ